MSTSFSFVCLFRAKKQVIQVTKLPSFKNLIGNKEKNKEKKKHVSRKKEWKNGK